MGPPGYGRHREFIGRRRSNEAMIVKKADMWP